VIPGGRRFGNNMRSWLRWRDAGRDVREEMQLHADLRAADLEARGLPPAEARRIAEREVGDPARVRAEVARLAAATDRRAAWTQPFADLRADAMHALRLFRRSPAFALVAVLTIGLGLGANAAIFALVNRVFLEPLPFDPLGNLVRVREYRQAPDGSRLMGDGSRRTADAVADRPDLFASSVPVVGTHRALLTGDGPLHVQATRVGRGFLAVVQVNPILGRAFTAEEEAAGEAAGAALISHRLWRTTFGGRSTVVGERMRLDERTFEIVGVLPAAVHIPYDSDVWFPSRFGDSERSVFILARLAAGVTLAQVHAELGPMGERLNEMYPDVLRGLGVTAVPAREYFAGDDGEVALALMGAVGSLLLIGCAFTIVQIAPAENKAAKDGTLKLEATSVVINGESRPLDADVTYIEHTLKGRGVGTSEAAKVGVGAAAGAIIGKVVGGGTGAAAGAVVGAAGGAAVAVETADRDVVIPVGGKIRISLRAPFTA
jgi:hypothetical protein